MAATRSILALALALGCARGSGGDPPPPRDGGLGRPDAALPGFDAQALPIDASSAGTDGGAPDPVDASGPGPTDGGAPPIDAPLTAIDAYRAPDATSAPDAFRPPDAWTPPDSYVPSGCTGPTLPPSGTATITGTTTGGAVWNRPNALSCPASYSPYDSELRAHTLCNAGAAATFDVEVAGFFDSYLVIYAGTSIPADPLSCLDGDDDGAGSLQPLVTGVAVGAGQSITVVVTGYDDFEYGAYDLLITRR